MPRSGSSAGAVRWIGGDWVPERHGPGPNWRPGMLARNAVLTASGRAALAGVLQALVPTGEVVLLPAYGCPALTQSVRLAQCHPAYYPGDGQLRPDWDAVAIQARTLRAAAAVVVHPWGWLQDGGGMRRLRASGVVVLEDASHTLANAPARQAAGPDAATALAASLRKALPLPAGGLQRAWHDRLRPAPPRAGEDGFMAARRAALQLPSGPDRHLALQRAEADLDRQAATGPADPVVVLALEELAARPASAGIRWREACRANWQTLRDALAGSACRAWAETLPDGVCPIGFVVRHPDRSRLAAWLLRQGIEAILHWPVAAEALPHLTRAERLLAASILTLPCDGRFIPADMAAVATACRSLPPGGRPAGQ